MVYTDVD
jgi:hypothetical protein